MNEFILLLSITLGTLFTLLAAIGLVRMPDLYLRISVTTKAATLGIGLILVGAAFHFGTLAITTRVIAIIFFMFLTAPVGAHLLGRASYFIGVPMWKRSLMDDLKGQYERKTHILSSKDKNQEQEKPTEPPLPLDQSKI